MLATFYVGNPAWSITSEILEEVFGQFGTVLSARVETYPDIGRSRGYGFVEMDVDDASRVAGETNGLRARRSVVACHRAAGLARGRYKRIARACPGWDLNPHWTVFETASSAGWDTGARQQG